MPCDQSGEIKRTAIRSSYGNDYLQSDTAWKSCKVLAYAEEAIWLDEWSCYSPKSKFERSDFHRWCHSVPRNPRSLCSVTFWSTEPCDYGIQIWHNTMSDHLNIVFREIFWAMTAAVRWCEMWVRLFLMLGGLCCDCMLGNLRSSYSSAISLKADPIPANEYDTLICSSWGSSGDKIVDKMRSGMWFDAICSKKVWDDELNPSIDLHLFGLDDSWVAKRANDEAAISWHGPEIKETWHKWLEIWRRHGTRNGTREKLRESGWACHIAASPLKTEAKDFWSRG